MPLDEDPTQQQPPQPPVPPPQTPQFRSVRELIQDEITRAFMPGTKYREKRDAARGASYLILGALQSKTPATLLTKLEERLDSVIIESSTISPEGSSQILSMGIGRDVAAGQRFPFGLALQLIEREDEISARKSYDLLVPILRQLIGLATTAGILQWERDDLGF